LPRAPISTLIPYTTLFRSANPAKDEKPAKARKWVHFLDVLVDVGAHPCGRKFRSSDFFQQPLGEGPSVSVAPGRYSSDTRRESSDRKSTRLNSSHRTISYA